MKRVMLALALLTAMACETRPPNMRVALTLFEGGHINRARAEMGRFIREKPENESVDAARQHILLIRRIKRIESQMVDQWRIGDMASARRSQGVIRFLHPAYAESAAIFALLVMPSPRLAAGTSPAYGEWEWPLFDAVSDSALAILAPLMLEVINRQEILAVHLAHRWARDQQGGIINGDETMRLVSHLETAYGYLREQSTTPERREIDVLVDQIDHMLQSSAAMITTRDEESVLAWTAAKGDLFGRLLALKSGLAERSR